MLIKKSTAGNSGLAKVAVQCSADTFVVNQTLVLSINICGKNRQLLVAANRYVLEAVFSDFAFFLRGNTWLCSVDANF